MSTEKKILRPFIRWAGGKQNLVSYLLSNLPPENCIAKYWEPFLGAGSLFFANGFKNAELSDVNEHLINAYKQIKKNPKSVYDRLLFHKRNFDKDYYYKIRESFNKHRSQNTIEQASRFIFLVHTSFNGIYRVNGKGEYNVPIGKMNPSLPTLEHLKQIASKLKTAKLNFKPYHNILSLVNQNDFIYLDPPYPKQDEKEPFQQFTIDKFSKKNQIELAEFANGLNDKGCDVMISNSNIPLIVELYRNWNIVEVPVIRYVSCKKQKIKLNELIIKNY
ncbi:MAG: Dam family site-specific DNA-(adenine-N6)-methyltransferase [Chitinophagaceae bacterium]|nr:Dam family site-specific DNA-(adenine-N6)-methyltransferase [Chitinophagaceae bacterium]